MLRKNGFTAEQVAAIISDFEHAGLEPVEVAMMAFAQKMTRSANDVTADDVAALRAHGLTDAEILDVTLVAGARNLFSKALEALGAEPDVQLLESEAEYRSVLDSL